MKDPLALSLTYFRKRTIKRPASQSGSRFALALGAAFALFSGLTQAQQQQVSLNSQTTDGTLFGLVSIDQNQGIELKLSMPPSLTTVDLSTPPKDVWTEIRQGFSIPEVESSEVSERERALMKNTRMVNTMLVRSRPYIYFIAQECEKRGLPTELALIPFIESQFNPHARSPSAAEGLWQFIPSTGRHFSLKQNKFVDERRDLRASTRAALDYLTYLYDMHGDWHLALISYNWGEGSVLKAIKKARDAGISPSLNNLDLPQETRQYIPKLQALKNLVLSPDRFNITLPDVPNEPYFTEIRHGGDLDLREIARLADIDLESIRRLNTGLNNPVMYAAHSKTLLVPLYHEDKVKETLENYRAVRLAQPGDSGRASSRQAAHGSPGPASRKYTIRRGDTLIEIAQKFQTSVEDIIRMNNIGKRSTLKPGVSIRVPAGEASNKSTPRKRR